MKPLLVVSRQISIIELRISATTSAWRSVLVFAKTDLNWLRIVSRLTRIPFGGPSGEMPILRLKPQAAP